jgi:dipeptidase
MNEHQVSMGESTCAAKLFSSPIGWQDGQALLNIGDLIQLGLERGATAREAIQVMGDLAVKYGFYGESYDSSKYGTAYVMGEAGEALTVIDPNEAWIFHILPDDTATSAVWAAQLIPSSHISIVANSFIIRQILPNSSNFLYSDNLYDVAIRTKFWNPLESKYLDFKLTFSPQRYHPEYSNNRIWRIFSLSNPSKNLPLETNADGDDYPFSQEVDHLLTLEEIMNFQRDLYQGTSLDLTKGLAAGPWGDPNRYQNNAWGNMTIWDTLEGTFPRSISLFRFLDCSALSLSLCDSISCC